ncbi:hypothetical protein BGZ80_004723 [Entomortierella chlamydospora]|uniref:Uncharacterized protein n=1 Tax=Entomortierella chlamydospora TaxID=101097 RepID=A0A9P6MZZ6_9FUNG|nr:hypothetical protein BGZ79_003464 [Entomortierella chlamydospora]KAG0020133.1 hypothetical protein BGZ80_004723 [Entomortierella chlamydospora]
MAVNMSYGSPSDFEPYSHFVYQASSQLDFTFYAPPHEGGSKDDPVPAAVFNAALPEDMPSLDLTGEANIDDLLNLDEIATPRKRDRGERIVWTPEEDEFLRAAVQMYGDKTEKWAKIAACVPGRTNKNCRKRWFHSLDPKLKKGPWTEEEDHLLRTGVQMFKGQWSKIAERIPGRTDDQCAKRWREGLDPLIDRAAWTREDDIILLQRFEEFGSQWQKIALAFPGRPGLHCRNRWRKIQRGLNHMKRVGKRRSQGSATDHAAVISETRRLEALLDSSNDDPDADVHYNATEDILLMQDAYLDDDFALEHGLMIDENGLAVLTDPKGEQQDANGFEDEKPYGCAVPDCSFESSSPSLLYYHFKASHAGTAVEKPFRCTMPGCETRKRYKNINGLQYHVTHAKNSPGHSGNSGHTINTHTGDDGADFSKVARTARQTTPSGHGKLSNAPQSNASSPSSDLRILMPAVTFDPAKVALSNPPTPAELQLQLHQSKQDHPSQLAIPHIARGAFNIPHSPSSLDASAASSQASSGASSPHIHRTVFHCPELGCDQTYHQIHGLNMHMANAHGHRAMNMRSSETAYGAESMVMPQETRVDFDIDMADLTSRPPSPMETNILLLEDSILRRQLDGVELMSMDTSSTPATSQDHNKNCNNGNPTFGMLTGKEFLFNSHAAGSIQNRVHFGSHISVGSHEPILLQPAQTIPIVTSPSGSISSASSSGIASTPSTPPTTVPQKPTKGQSSRSVSKRFACSALNCQKSYATASTLNNHIRNDHPDLYVGNAVNTAGSRTSASSPKAAQRSQASSENTRSSDLPREDEDPVDWPYKCLVPGCGKGYININGLKNHLLQTHGSTPKSNPAQ